MKKYEALHPPLLARITAEERAKHGENPKAEKSAKTRLHQLYGAYNSPNTYKKASALLDAWEKENIGIEADSAEFLRLHASTRERLPFYPQFYRFILDHMPPPASVLDLGCGFNPFALPIILKELRAKEPHADVRNYHALDICTRQATLINRFLKLCGLPQSADCADLIAHAQPSPADVAFLFKLIPVLEAQANGSGFALVRSLEVNHLVITYPTKSLTGKEKGMAQHYRQAFQNALSNGQLAPFNLQAEAQINNEQIYILKR
ncbi:MAG: hypothetical protein FWC71_04830 [Defluviitaleaceae bacterium]|nr:hypothetical protein [Defluviitaleaceae bacterium]